MNEKIYNNQYTTRENFLMILLKKVIREYKILLDYTHSIKPLRIVEIIELSNVPGETVFSVQITHKACLLRLSAAEIITNGYNLKDFSKFHAAMIQKAAEGKLIEYLQKLNDSKSQYTIESKKLDKESQLYIFTIKINDKELISRTAAEISSDKNILANLDMNDIYDIGYTHGNETILQEKIALVLAKNK